MSRQEDGMEEGARLVVALISETFPLPDGPERLAARLHQAKERGADLAVLPELPLHPWIAATQEPSDDDAEGADGPRHRIQAEIAREVGISVVGGVIIREYETGARHSTALVFDARGELLGGSQKLHLPEEPGFWETSHYDPGEMAPKVIDGLPLRLGVQICSDINRPEGCHVLGAMGAEAVIVPRATERRTYDRWRTVFRANAMTSAVYVLSVNRPLPEGAGIGGPSVAFDPNGDLILETEEPVAIVTLERSVVDDARKRYPGYLPVRADIYAESWEAAAKRSETELVSPVAGDGARGTPAGRAS